LGGWGVGVITEFRTGSPYSVLENTNTSNTYAASQRPNILGDPQQLSNWRNDVKGTTFFDTALFAAPGTGVFGNAPRSVCCGPGFANIDASVHKWFTFTERLKLQFRGDFLQCDQSRQLLQPGHQTRARRLWHDLVDPARNRRARHAARTAARVLIWSDPVNPPGAGG
ncbi:MAG TPA: hypothetical protein VKN76_08920, partial [Kiloniellaceae bacterium]|nr:hypothetical protein [Kiloniellaceae bacterium]